MKKTIVFLLLVISFITVLAGDVIKVLQVYSGGKKVSIPVSNIDSLKHSLYDADSILHSDYTTSTFYAIDRDYQIPIASIDSIVIGEIDMQQFEAQTKVIMDFINEQTELELNTFQTNLLSWLNANEFIQEATINESKDFITILFKNGMDFYIDFQDMSIYDGIDQTNAKVAPKKAIYNDSDGFHDVSSQTNERIIDNPNILFIKGMDMFGSSLVYTAEKGFLDYIDSSPVEYVVDFSNESLDFVIKNFADYGIIIISQTHGGGGGSFMVSRESQTNQTNASFFSHPNALIIYFENKEDIIVSKRVVRVPKTEISIYAEPVYLIRPSLIEKKLKGNNETIVYGNYCWSGGLSKYIKSNTVVGFNTMTNYAQNYENTKKFIKMLTRGYTCEDFVSNPYRYDYEQSETGEVVPTTNHQNSKQRFFSIKTNDIAFDENGSPVITGQIKGYKNLKHDNDDFNYFLLIHKGDKQFTPADGNWEAGAGSIDVKPDGTFTLKCSDDYEIGKYYGFIVGFMYKGNYYHGSSIVAEIPERPICPDNNHPHMIDLGLPSGTKWACCNVDDDASKQSPTNYGSYYAWGETEEKSGEYIPSTYQYAYLDNNGRWWDYDTRHYYRIQNIGSDISGTQYDVAHVKWGGGWQMPSLTQIKELLDNTKREWTYQNGIAGRKFTGGNGGTIFLPAADCRDWRLEDVGYHGCYWSSTLYENQYKAYNLNFGLGDVREYYYDRYHGLSVRPVR